MKAVLLCNETKRVYDLSQIQDVSGKPVSLKPKGKPGDRCAVDERMLAHPSVQAGLKAKPARLSTPDFKAAEAPKKVSAPAPKPAPAPPAPAPAAAPPKVEQPAAPEPPKEEPKKVEEPALKEENKEQAKDEASDKKPEEPEKEDPKPSEEKSEESGAPRNKKRRK